MLADAIATAVLVKGFNAGIEWINQLDDIEGMLIGQNNDGSYKTARSKGFIF